MDNFRKTCIFDIDGTLFFSNSTFDFLKFSFHASQKYKAIDFVFGNIFAKIMNRILFKLFSMDLKRIMYLKVLTGKSRTELERLADKFCYEFLNSRQVIPIQKILSDMKEENIYFVSATLDFLAERMSLFLKNALQLKSVTVISSRLTYKDGICTGRIKTDLLNKKLKALEKAEISSPFDLVVSDDVFDIQLMENSLQNYVVLNRKNENKWKRKLKNVLFDYKTIHAGEEEK